jgi:hypothetical protein
VWIIFYTFEPITMIFSIPRTSAKIEKSTINKGGWIVKALALLKGGSSDRLTVNRSLPSGTFPAQ